MNALSLFAGIGGFDLGLERAGHRVVGQVEIEPFCRRVLERRWPEIERWGDVRGVTGWSAEDRQRARDGSALRQSAYLSGADLLTGGFPCQDLSVAGRRRGLRGERSGLFWEIVRIAKDLKPAWGLFENVPGLVSSHRGRDLWLVLQGLRECWPAVGWRVLDSQHFGVPQRRRRLFLVGGPDEAGVAQVLALAAGGDGDSPARGEAGPELARCLATGTNRARYDGDTETFVTIAFTERSRAEGRTFESQDELSYALTNPGAGGRSHSRQVFTIHAQNANVQVRHAFADDQSRTLDGMSGPDRNQGGTAIVESNSVRRLTPVECERLQGFPDGWTCLCQPLEAYVWQPEEAALDCACPDGPRYRALGNAVTVSVIQWLGRRLQSL